MHNFRIYLPVLIGIYFLLAVASVGQSNDPPAKPADVPVELTVIGPDLKPLADKEVQVVDFQTFAREPRRSITARTDAAGALKFDWELGTPTLAIRANGIGFGITGIAEYVPGRTVKPPLAPLVATGSIRGSIPAAVLGRAIKLTISQPYRSSDSSPVDIKPDGSFLAEDLPPGEYVFRLFLDGKQRSSVTTYIAPGEHSKGVQFRLPTAEEMLAQDRSLQNDTFFNPPDRGKVIRWIDGQVNDARGDPVAGAKVYAYVVVSGGIRLEGVNGSTATDANGKFSIDGQAYSVVSASVVAHKPGLLPSIVWPVPVKYTGTPPARASLLQSTNLVLSDQGGGLTVAVERDNALVTGAVVRAWRDGAETRGIWARGDASAEMDQLLAPSAVTNTEGVAEFVNLPPGSYHVEAALLPPSLKGILNRSRPLFSASGPSGVADGVAVRVGQKQMTRMALQSRKFTTIFQVKAADDRPVERENLSISFAQVGSTGGWSTSARLTPDRRYDYTFDSPGLWSMRAWFRDIEAASINTSNPPYYEAKRYVAASALLSGQVGQFAADRVLPASATVDVKDLAGRPVQATVTIGTLGIPDSATALGTTDPDGHIEFAGLPEWSLGARALRAGQPRVKIGGYDQPLPADEELLHHPTFFPVAALPTRVNQQAKVSLQEREACYLRGKVAIADGKTPREYTIYLADGSLAYDATIQYSRSTGEFVAGPFLEGAVTLQLMQAVDTELREVSRKSVQLRPGVIPQIDLDPAQPTSRPAALPSGNVFISMSGISTQGGGADGLHGKVFLSDGVTPASGAAVLFYDSSVRAATMMGVTDALGTIHPRGLWRTSAANGEAPKPADTTPSTLVAFLPGQRGATLVPASHPGQFTSITLPESRIIKGTVRVSGAPLRKFNATFRVVAEYQDRGALNQILSLNTTPNADGTFELAGLTVGSYLVQAAMDDIWVSKPVKLIVGEDTVQNSIDLDVGQPGAQVVVSLSSDGSQKVSGRRVSIDRAGGPLDQMLWPAEFEADREGKIYIPTLEVGRHTIRLVDGQSTQTVEVPPIGQGQSVTVTLPLK